MSGLKRQFISDAEGNPIGIILPLEEYVLVKAILEQRAQPPHERDKLDLITQAAHDPLFLADLRETMSDFDTADAD